MLDFIKFTDWQELGLKKDIEAIKKELCGKKVLDYSLLWELIVTVFSIIVSDYLGSQTGSSEKMIILIIIAACCSLPVIVILFVKIINNIIAFIKSYNGIIHSSKFVNLFDNEICLESMIAFSFKNMISSQRNDYENVFYCQQANYYINKAIDQLATMQPVLAKVVSNDIETVKKKKIISKERMINIIEVLEKSRPKITFCDNHLYIENIRIDNTENYSSNFQDKFSEQYNEMLREIKKPLSKIS